MTSSDCEGYFKDPDEQEGKEMHESRYCGGVADGNVLFFILQDIP